MYKNNTSAVIVKGARFMPCTLTDENSGKTYEIKVIGWQIPLLKKYENITTFSTIEFLYYNY